MVKAYLRYEHRLCFGVVASTSARSAKIVEGSQERGETAVAPGLEGINLWHLRKGVLLKRLVSSSQADNGGASSEGVVTSLCRIDGKNQVAAGHSNGTLNVWDLSGGTCEASFSGHKTAVSCLSYSAERNVLASGGRDSDVVLWDLVGETGLFRLKGHRNEVTAIVFLEDHDALVSASKDACIRVWSLESQHCTQVVTMHRGEVWSMDLSPDGRCLVTGSVDEQLLCFKVKTTEELDHEEGESKSQVLEHSGTIIRRSQSKIQHVQFEKTESRNHRYFGVLGVGKVFELYRMLTPKEAAKKAKRKLKRKREKMAQQQQQSGGNGDAPAIEGGAEHTLADQLNLETTISLKHKIKSFFFTCSRSGKPRIVLALATNSIEVHEINPKEEEEDQQGAG